MKAVYLSALSVLLGVSLCVPHDTANAQTGSELNKTYADESHCLVGPEIRSDKDNPISCFCRDAIVDARYVWQNYLLTGRDQNLNGVQLVLEIHATRMCGEHPDPHEAIIAEDWQWTGPEVTRTYPPESEIAQITPDSYGVRRVRYKVRLIFHDQQGQVSSVENFTAMDILPTHRKPDAAIKN